MSPLETKKYEEIKIIQSYTSLYKRFKIVTSWGAMVFSLIPAGVGDSVKECFLYVILKLCAKFQFPTIPATDQKVCGGVVWWVGGWLKPTLVFSLAQAKQYVPVVKTLATTNHIIFRMKTP